MIWIVRAWMLAASAALLLAVPGCQQSAEKETDSGAVDTWAADRGEPDLAPDSPPVACDPASLAQQVDPLRMLADLKQLVESGERFTSQGQALTAAYLKAELGKLPGVTLTEQSYTHDGEPYVNLVATIEGTPTKDRYAMAGAHYDAPAAGSPAADDNASGAVAVLEAARVLSTCPGHKTTRLVFFSNAHNVGSTAYVASLKTEVPPDRVEGFINVDMVAFGPADEDLDLATRTEHQTLATRLKTAIDASGVVETTTFVGNHCG